MVSFNSHIYICIVFFIPFFQILNVNIVHFLDVKEHCLKVTHFVILLFNVVVNEKYDMNHIPYNSTRVVSTNMSRDTNANLH